jgi:hypothetical protein
MPSFVQSPWSISGEFERRLASWPFCHSMETAWEFNAHCSLDNTTRELLFVFAGDEVGMQRLAAQGSKRNALTGADFAAAPCPFPSCWRQPTRANRNTSMAGRTKEKCSYVVVLFMS